MTTAWLSRPPSPTLWRPFNARLAVASTIDAPPAAAAAAPNYQLFDLHYPRLMIAGQSERPQALFPPTTKAGAEPPGLSIFPAEAPCPRPGQ
jgi:hypothetical protein